MLTDRQRRVIVDISDGDWHQLVPHHARSVVQRVFALGLIRCDCEHAVYEDRIWTITPSGMEALDG